MTLRMSGEETLDNRARCIATDALSSDLVEHVVHGVSQGLSRGELIGHCLHESQAKAMQQHV